MTVTSAERDLVEGIVAGLAGLPPGSLWPGFDPATTPLAIGLPAVPATWLLNHAAAGGYADPFPSEERGGSSGLRRTGIDERLVANSVTMVEGRLTATIIADGAATVAELAALAAHECFHVFHASRYPHWGANEASLLTYPWDDPPNLAMANQELDLLTRGRNATDDATGTALAHWALALRRRRSARLPTDCVEYENAVELTEGTARYIEDRTADALGLRLPEPDDARGIDVRRRCYRTGRDWCHLLDRLAGPEWPARLAEGPDEPMPVLTDLLASVGGEAGSELADDTWRAGLTTASDAIAAERARRDVRLDALRRSDNGSIVIRGRAGIPLRVAGFDPMNLTALPGGTVIHERYVALTSGDTQITILGRAAVTTAAGEHPLFSGIERADVRVDDQFLAANRVLSRDALTALGIRIVGPFEMRRTGTRTTDVMPGDASGGIGW